MERSQSQRGGGGGERVAHRHTQSKYIQEETVRDSNNVYTVVTQWPHTLRAAGAGGCRWQVIELVCLCARNCGRGC